jgi:hypothetical protein
MCVEGVALESIRGRGAGQLDRLDKRLGRLVDEIYDGATNFEYGRFIA